MTRIPDFFIVGQPKCGTTALYEALRRHPQIYMPDAKEPNFFSSEWQTSHSPPETLDAYLSLFEPALPSQRIGEASVFYLTSPTAPDAIAQLQPHARLIAILREPASFLRSLHLQFVQSDFEPERNLHRALALEPQRREGRGLPATAGGWRRRLLYTDHIRYVDHLRRYDALFPPEQMMVLVYDDFKRDNSGILRRILRFLEVDDDAPPAVEDMNPTVGVRSRHLNRLVFREEALLWRVVTGVGKIVMPARARERLRRFHSRFVYGAPPPPDERLMADLRRRFKPEVVALSEYLGRDLVTLWGYDAPS